MPKKFEQFYFPLEEDQMWNLEVESILPWLSGKGVDIGCSNRSIFPEDVRVDIDKDKNPDFLCSGDELPFEENKFDYLYGIHTLEHFKDTKKTLCEWARVVKSGGIIAIIHPDVFYTKIQRPFGLLPGENPYYKHENEHTYESFLNWFRRAKIFNLKILSSGVACGSWSFFVVFQKK